MRVLHVCGMYLPATEWGGPTYAIANYADALRLAGVESEVFATTARGSSRMPVIPPGATEVRRINVTYFRAPHSFRSFIAPGLVAGLARRVREFDLVHVHLLWAFPGIVAARAAERAGVPYVVSPHGCLDPWSLEQWRWIKKAFFVAFEDRTLRRSALVHYTAEAERASAPDRFRALPSAVVPNVVHAAEFATLGRPEVRARSRDVLILGRIHLMKGFDVLVPAMREVIAAEPRARLVIAGVDESGYQTEVERSIAAAGIGASVVFTGHLDSKARARVLEETAILVQPSHRENFGMSVAEGMASGLPVVVSDRVNICDDVAAADAGRVVPRDASALARQIVELLREPDRRLAMGEHGRALVASRYSATRVGQALREAYEQAVRNSGSHHAAPVLLR